MARTVWAACHSGTGRLGAALCLGAALGAQAGPALEVAFRDGRVWLATAVHGDPARELELVVGGERRTVGARELLAVHGVVQQVVELPAVRLGGGEVVRGLLVGGDAAGDHLTLQSPALGRLELAVDRVAALCAPAAGHLRPEDLPLPEGVAEAVLQRARIGYDLVAGTLHQFGEPGVRFQPAGEAAPRWFRLQDFVALRLADPVGRPAPAPVLLLTRTGDRLGVSVRGFTGGAVRCELEHGAVVELPFADLACLCFVDGLTFLSDLPPQEVAESGFDGDVVHAWRADHSAVGGPLVAGERTHGKGLGVHSRSRLSFRVPDGAAAFWTRVAVDASAALLPVRADADVRIAVNGTVRFRHQGLAAGPPRDSGLLPVRPGDTVTLEVGFGKGRDLGDRVDWLSPVFLPAKASR